MAVAVIYGLNYSIAKDVMPDFILPRGFILVRVLGATLLFWLTARFMQGQKMAKSDHVRLALCGLFGVACNQLLFFEGLNLTTPISAAVMMTTNPILVLVMSALILKEALSASRIVGIALGLIGALILISQGGHFNQIFSGDHSLGNLLVFLNAASYGAYLVLVKPLMQRYQPITVIKWVFLYGLLIVLPFGVPQFVQIEWQSMPSFIFWEVIFVVVCTTYMAYLLNVFALKTVSSTTVSFYIYLQPVVATLAAILLATDSLTLVRVLGASFIFVGVYFVSFFKR